MKEFETKDYKVFDLFNNQWGLVTAGTLSNCNACTVSWGSLGTIWNGPHGGRPIVTVYINPSRFTWEFLKENDTFTVSFFPEKYRDVLNYLGTVSGKTEDKIRHSRLTVKEISGTVGYEEAELTFVCHKLYQGEFQREGLADEINHGIYQNWDPHWMFVGEIIEAIDRR